MRVVLHVFSLLAMQYEFQEHYAKYSILITINNYFISNKHIHIH